MRQVFIESVLQRNQELVCFHPGGSLRCLSSPSPQGMAHSATLGHCSLDRNSGLLLSHQGCSCFFMDGDTSPPRAR